mmetsp:Transcript_30142/g.96205  ORF Transcript_30142/g.96205 Transcript_30142/m.96205 type:complete len:209 (+) Transcript_30142:148-774(+)
MSTMCSVASAGLLQLRQELDRRLRRPAGRHGLQDCGHGRPGGWCLATNAEARGHHTAKDVRPLVGGKVRPHRCGVSAELGEQAHEHRLARASRVRVHAAPAAQAMQQEAEAEGERRPGVAARLHAAGRLLRREPLQGLSPVARPASQRLPQARGLISTHEDVVRLHGAQAMLALAEQRLSTEQDAHADARGLVWLDGPAKAAPLVKPV